MKIRIFTLFISIIAVLMINNCGSGSLGTTTSSETTEPESPPVDLNFVKISVESIPFIYGNLVAEGVAEAYKNVMQNFFKAECHDDSGSINFCPAGATIDVNNKFTSTTLVGLLYLADMKLSDIFQSSDASYQECQRGDGATGLTNHTGVFNPSNSDKFVLDFGTLLDCVANMSYSENKITYFLYSKSNDGKTFAEVSTRKQHQSDNPSTGGVMSDVYQPYLSKDSSNNSNILALNLASYDAKNSGDYAMRGVVLLNIQSHKFIVKQSTFNNNTTTNLISLGKAGYDSASSAWVDGYYKIKVVLGDGENNSVEVCVRNAEVSVTTDDSNCSGINNFFIQDGWTADDVYEWLGMTEQESTDLTGFKTYFDNPDSIPADDIPHNGADYFPDSITAE